MHCLLMQYFHNDRNISKTLISEICHKQPFRLLVKVSNVGRPVVKTMNNHSATRRVGLRKYNATVNQPVTKNEVDGTMNTKFLR
jgi:hypothetical protein